MGKDTRLVNIYIKIHNKRNLTIEDLNYLAKYDPECFEKTCKNVVYNVPDAKQILHPQADNTKMGAAQQEESKQASYGGQAVGSLTGGAVEHLGEEARVERGDAAGQPGESILPGKEGQNDVFAPAPPDKEQMEAALANLKHMEEESLPVGEIDVNMVKNLLGNLYMEMLFPHTGRAKFFSMEDQEYLSVFNKKV
ncbi:MAG: hypothetical protein HFH39_01140 [Lachnospiraceae bacterium]|nr:hypothetical protein [Lachnospiraceae bacterium]